MKLFDYLKLFIKKGILRFKFPNTTFYNNVQVDNFSKVGIYSVLFSNTVVINSSIGKFTYLQSSSSVYNSIIGDYCSIASNVSIGLPDHPIGLISTSPVFYDNSQPLPYFFVENKTITDKINLTSIGSDVWIGQGVLIKSGLIIGTGSIIGAGSVVTKDVQPYSIVAGVPARTIRFRFSEELIIELIESKWWEEDPKILIKLKDCFNDPEIFLEKLKCLKS
uniref:CatB-related O-acetyltransferase n=1 Tax=Algoriphagus sp. TaxID=1872435 RepID=UPI004048B8F4